ncbi:MAG: hypothetical protein Q4P15_09245 [Propionibacteriaceae bacterium]|nr:hypothetical protein [Propionibacteriaceae bacterium]
MTIVTGHVLGDVVELTTIEFDGESELPVKAVQTFPATKARLPFKSRQPVSALDSMDVSPLKNALDALSGDSTKIFQHGAVGESLAQRQSLEDSVRR